MEIDAILAAIARLENGQPLQPEEQISSEAGYRIDTDGIRGISLLSPKQYGYQLVARLKDSNPFLLDEARFWGSLLAKLVADLEFDLVTATPSSGKRPEHLATILAQQVAQDTGILYEPLFVNAKPRGRRASLVGKLKERKEYVYQRDPDGARILVVDDVLHTRSTAHACQNVCGTDRLFFLILYRA